MRCTLLSTCRSARKRRLGGSSSCAVTPRREAPARGVKRRLACRSKIPRPGFEPNHSTRTSQPARETRSPKGSGGAAIVDDEKPVVDFEHEAATPSTTPPRVVSVVVTPPWRGPP